MIVLLIGFGLGYLACKKNWFDGLLKWCAEIIRDDSEPSEDL